MSLKYTMYCFKSLFFIFSFLLLSCSHSSEHKLQSFALDKKAPTTLRLKWKKPMHANISYINLSDDGKKILISTSQDKQKRYLQKSRLHLINNKGKTLWSHTLSQSVRSQSFSSDGNLIAVTTYDAKLQVFNAKGKFLWEKPHFGRPLILPRANKILLLNDDDADIHTAFTLYNEKGALLSSLKIKHEPLDLYVDSINKEHFVSISFKNGEFSIYNLAGDLLWNSKVAGEIVSISLSKNSETNTLPKIYVLSTNKKDKKQTLNAFSAQNHGQLKQDWNKNIEYRYEVMKTLGSHILLYGNNSFGQVVSALNQSNGDNVWTRGYSYPIPYSSLVFTLPSAHLFTIALETDTPTNGLLHVSAFLENNDLKWSVPVKAEDGIFSYATSELATSLTVGVGQSGDGQIEYYQH